MNGSCKLEQQSHCDVLSRILFIYAKLNPGIRYIQGMNEILAPIYYVYSQDSNEYFSERAEIDTFFSFVNIMAELRDNFLRSLDDTSLGIKAKVQFFD